MINYKLLTFIFLHFTTSLATSSSGCGTNPPFNLSPGGGTRPFNITSGRRHRTYLLSIPQNYNVHNPAPLLVSYHGAAKDASNQEKISEFTLDKWNVDSVVAYPNGIGHHWQGASYSTPGVDDVAFTADLLDHLEASFCIDSDRIYAAGKSNGGGFVGLLTCNPAISTRFAAFAAVSGAFYPDTRIPCRPEGKYVPIIDFHGMADTKIHYYGGTGNGGPLIGIPQWLQGKAALGGCSEAPDEKRVLKDGNVWEQVWHCGASGGKRVLVAYNETGLRHSWPGTEQKGDKLVIATPKILEFFKEWP